MTPNIIWWKDNYLISIALQTQDDEPFGLCKLEEGMIILENKVELFPTNELVLQTLEK